MALLPLPNLRIPGHPNQPLYLDGKPLTILDESAIPSPPDTNDNNKKIENLTPAIAIATVLYKWHPSALFALLDLSAWFSFTWTLTLADGKKIEIGRIRNQISMGTLDEDGLWEMMVSFTMQPGGADHSVDDGSSSVSNYDNDGGGGGGIWHPNPSETIFPSDDDNKTSSPSTPEETLQLATTFLQDVIMQRRWLLPPAGQQKGCLHEFFIESRHLGMDPWGDGMRMNPHWLYHSLDRGVCTVCGGPSASFSAANDNDHTAAAAAAATSKPPLQICGRCGTAAYCSATCQRHDWPVHKSVCVMSKEDRGKALYYSQNGGLVGWRGGEEGEKGEKEGEKAEKEKEK